MNFRIISKIKNKLFSHKNNLFLVTVPFFNAQKWIGRCIKSLKIQKYNKFKCVLIDDVSNDNSFEIASNFIKNDNRFSIIKNTEKTYPANNIAKGIKYLNPSDENIIVNLDGDDWLNNDNVFSILNNKYNKYRCWMTYGSYKTYPDEKIGLFSRKIPNNIIKNQTYRANPWMASHLRSYKYKLWIKLDQKDLFNELTGNPIKSVGDQAIMFPLLEMSGYRALFIKEILYINNRDNPLNEDKVDHTFQLNEEKYIRNKKQYLLLKNL